jgi:hypothetical protein
MIADLEKLRTENLTRINVSKLDEWLPYTFVRNGGNVAATTVACEDFYVPTAGSTESGITEVASLDLNDPGATPKETAILGRADTVYGSADTLYLAAHAWVEPPIMWNDMGESDGVAVSGGGSTPPSTGSTEPAPAPVEEPAPAPAPGGKVINVSQKVGVRTTPAQGVAVTAYSTTKTHLHKFEFKTDPKFPNYQASGTVKGNVKDQFSLDDRDGTLRVATTEGRMYVDANGKYVSP